MEAKNCAEIVKVIRTLLTSSKNGLLINEIVGDYEQIEGNQIPFTADTLELVLRDSNQFAMIDTKHGTRVMSKPSKETNTIKSTPSSPTKGKKKGNVTQPQRALRPTTDNQWKGTAYSQAYTQMPNRSVKKAFTHSTQASQTNSSHGGGINSSATNNNTTNSGGYRAILKQSNIKQVPKDDNPHSAIDEATNWSSHQLSKPFPMRSQHQQRNVYHERMNRKPNENGAATVPAARSSVQSRLAIQKTISIDATDSVGSDGTQVSNGNDTMPTTILSTATANGKLVDKVSAPNQIHVVDDLLKFLFHFVVFIMNLDEKCENQ